MGGEAEMIIPSGVNFIEFYKAAKAKGILIKSRYKGVCVGTANKDNDITWKLQLQKNGVITNKHYPFTEQGELQSAQHYQRLKNAK